MRATYGYESILRAVGQVLDRAGVRAISLHETEDGLVVEGVSTANHARVRLTYDLAQLNDLIDETEGNIEVLFAEPAPVFEGRRLREFLARHEVVAAR